jgi:hypothetical protein
MIGEIWLHTADEDIAAFGLYMRHYSAWKRSKSSKKKAFCGPGQKMVLVTPDYSALFVWKVTDFRDDDQAGIYCAIFRNEGEQLSSELIRHAVKEAFQRWGIQRCFTYVDPKRVVSKNPGYCFIKAGWRRVHGRRTSRGLMLFEYEPEKL